MVFRFKIKLKLSVKNSSDEEYEQYGNQSEKEYETYNNKSSDGDHTDRPFEHSEYLHYVPENQQEYFKVHYIISNYLFDNDDQVRYIKNA